MKPKKQLVEKLAEAPTILLEKGIQETELLAKGVLSKKPIRGAGRYWRTLGPGLTTGASDDDPAGIATYSQTGAKFGFGLLWLSLFTFPLMAVVQEMCARIGLVTGRGLAANIATHYPKWVLYLCAGLLFAANTFNLGADLGAMAAAGRLLLPGTPFILLVFLFALISLGLEIFTTYGRYARYLKYLALVLLLYVVTMLVTPGIDWSAIVRQTVTPSVSLSRDWLFLVCAILGTTISPYLFFWQTGQEVEERMLGSRARAQRLVVRHSDIRKMRIDVWSGMFLSNLVMFFIIAACGATLYRLGGVDINTASQAAEALKPVAGNAAYALFTIGIIGTGMLAVPVLAGSSAYALAESFGWKSGLYRRLKEARAFYGVIILAIGIGLALNFVGINPIDALLYSAVLNGLVAPVVLVLIVRLSSDPQVMGHRVNRPLVTGIGWFTIVIMALAGVAAIASLVF